VSVLAIMAMDASVNDALKEAKNAGIAVISAGVETDPYDYLMLTDNADSGAKIAQMAADWVNEKFGGKTDIAVITTTVNPNMAERSDAMVKKLGELLPDSKIVMNGSINGQVGEGTSFAENLLEKYPDCKVVVSYSDQPAVEAVEVFKAAGKTSDDIGIFGNDATSQALQEIKDGDLLRGTIDMGNVGSDLGNAVIKWLNGEIKSGDVYTAKNIPVTSANISDYVK